MESLEKIGLMLERFYQGETTLEEEKLLQDYFSSTTVPEELLPDRELFQNFASTGGSVPLPGDLNKKILNTIDREERREERTKRISLYSLSGLAAGLLALIAVYLFFLRTDRPALFASQQVMDTYEDPMDAYEEAKRTLAYVSVKLNQGSGELRHVQHVSKTTTAHLKSLSKIKKGSHELGLLGNLKLVELEQSAPKEVSR
ncbi:MAG: hypothetical protein ABFS10_11675 [Bacteroidota bacterium]